MVAFLLALGVTGTALASNKGFKFNSGIIKSVNRILKGSGVSIGRSVDEGSNHPVLEVNLDLQNQQFQNSDDDRDDDNDRDGDDDRNDDNDRDDDDDRNGRDRGDQYSDTLKFKLNLVSLPESGFQVQGADGSLYNLRECPNSGQLELQLADVVVGNDLSSFWVGVNSPQHVALSVDSLDIPSGPYALPASLKVDLNPGRAYYSLFSHGFAQVQDWSCKKYLTFWFKGMNSGVPHSLWVRSTNTGRLALYFTDDSDQWKLLVFDLQVPSTLDLANVTGLQFAHNDKTIVETFRMQALHLLIEAP